VLEDAILQDNPGGGQTLDRHRMIFAANAILAPPGSSLATFSSLYRVWIA
jgi:hypothetical protein